jgi:hypothetical protein
MQMVAGWIENNAAFFCILLLVGLSRYFFSIIQIFFVATSAASSNLHLQALVATPQEGKLLKAVDVLIIVSINMWALMLLDLPNPVIWRILSFRVPHPPFSVCCAHLPLCKLQSFPW